MFSHYHYHYHRHVLCFTISQNTLCFHADILATQHLHHLFHSKMHLFLTPSSTQTFPSKVFCIISRGRSISPQWTFPIYCTTLIFFQRAALPKSISYIFYYNNTAFFFANKNHTTDHIHKEDFGVIWKTNKEFKCNDQFTENFW